MKYRTPDLVMWGKDLTLRVSVPGLPRFCYPG
jgi:hypothetical protein